MKVCPHCGETYSDFVDFCFGDGSVLALEAAAQIASEPDAFDAPPPPKMLQGSQQRASYTRSATPVPRARRPGRSLITGSEPNYTPPAVEEPQAPPPEPQGMAYADEEQLVESDEVLAGESVEEDWGEPEQRREPTPTPAPVSAEVSMTRAELAAARAAEMDDEEEDEAAAGMGMWAVVGAGFVGVVVVATLGLFTIGSFLVPDNGDPVDPVPVVPVPVEPAPLQPDPVPEPVAPIPIQPEPAPIEPEPTETDGVANVEPIQPEPIEPVPVEPVQPVEPAPVRPVEPAPVRPAGPAPVRPQPQPAAMVTVNFVSVPSTATLYVDGVSVATTPFSHRLSEGSHKVRMEKAGFETHSARVVISPSSTRYDATLTPIAGAPAPEPAPVPGPEPVVPAPEPVEPEPVSEPVNTMVFAQDPPGAQSMKLIWRGQRLGMPATIPYPAGGTTLVFEMTSADGTTWQSAVKCGPPNIGVNRLMVAQACGAIQGKP